MNARLPLLSLCLLALSTSLHAVPLRVLAWDDSVAARKLAIVDAKGPKPLEKLDPLSRSQAFDVTPGGEQPAKLQALDRLDDKGVAAVQPIAFPEGIKRPLLLLLEDPKSATGIRTMVLEDDVANFQWGTIRLINATNQQLLIKCGTKAAPVPTGWKPVDISLGGVDRNVEVIVGLREKPLPPIYSSIWEYKEGSRQLVFVVPNTNPADGPFSFKFIMENRAGVEAPKAGDA